MRFASIAIQLALAATALAALAPRQSSGACTFTACPADQTGAAPITAADDGAGTLTCTYPDETCLYSTTDGSFIEGDIPANCPKMANPDPECAAVPRRRAESNLAAYRRKMAERRAHEAPAVQQGMKERGALGAAKKARRSA